MQIDPSKPLSPQLIPASSTVLEELAAATCASVGYTVLRGLCYELGGQHAAQIDVYASIFSPWRESRILFECKGGTPSFNDIRKFASLRQLLSPPADDHVLIVQQACPTNRQELAELLGCRIVEKPQLSSFVLPLLGGAPLRKQRVVSLNRYLAWQALHTHFVGQTALHARLKEHYRFLTTDLWLVGDPEQQVGHSFDAYQNRFKTAPEDVAISRKQDVLQAAYNAPDDIVESAFYVMLLHRIMNAYAVERYTLDLMQHGDAIKLITHHGPQLASAVSALSSRPRHLDCFPAFLQTFFFVWGGFLYMPRRDEEVAAIAEECSTSPAAVEHYLQILDDLYSRALFQDWTDFRFFKWVPGAFRALGGLHRRALDPTAYASVTFFGTSQPKHLLALDRGLSAIGGHKGLRYTP
ncbi:MAG: hypothetical protein KF689_14440 [Gemmatimonadaceae bacterium]|nr:hypothetical protein [Gemmatimonadaceae bacterium]